MAWIEAFNEVKEKVGPLLHSLAEIIKSVLRIIVIPYSLICLYFVIFWTNQYTESLILSGLVALVFGGVVFYGLYRFVLQRGQQTVTAYVADERGNIIQIQHPIPSLKIGGGI